MEAEAEKPGQPDQIVTITEIMPKDITLEIYQSLIDLRKITPDQMRIIQVVENTV